MSFANAAVSNIVGYLSGGAAVTGIVFIAIGLNNPEPKKPTVSPVREVRDGYVRIVFHDTDGNPIPNWTVWDSKKGKLVQPGQDKVSNWVEVPSDWPQCEIIFYKGDKPIFIKLDPVPADRIYEYTVPAWKLAELERYYNKGW